MKHVLILSAFIALSVQLNATHLASELNLRLQHQAWFTVTIDNQCYETPTNFFHTENLAPGNHYMQVTRLDHGYYGPFTVQNIVFSGMIHIPARSKVHAFIDRAGQFRINKITALFPAHSPVYNECAPVPLVYGMNEYDFNQLKNTVSHLSFESSKIAVIKQALSMNKITSRQAAELVSMLTFESGKLEIAKYAYHVTLDKHNYFILNDAFSFESSIHELNNFIYRS